MSKKAPEKKPDMVTYADYIRVYGLPPSVAREEDKRGHEAGKELASSFLRDLRAELLRHSAGR